MRSYNPEQIMLSAAVRRSSRDLNVMKEKLIFSGEKDLPLVRLAFPSVFLPACHLVFVVNFLLFFLLLFIPSKVKPSSCLSLRVIPYVTSPIVIILFHSPSLPAAPLPACDPPSILPSSTPLGESATLAGT